jgi:hypothetical protein
MFRGIFSKATTILALTSLAAGATLIFQPVTTEAVETQKANPNYYYDRETAFIVNNAIDNENGGMYLAVNKDGSKINNPIPVSVWGYPDGTIPGVSKSHIGQATCIRYLITEYQRATKNGVSEINSLLNNQTIAKPDQLIEVARKCADFINNKMIIKGDDDIDEDVRTSNSPDQGDTANPNALYYWGITNQAGNSGYFDDSASNTANGVSRSESVIPWTLAELALVMKKAGYAPSDYLPYQKAAIAYFNWRTDEAVKTPAYSGQNFNPLAGRDFYYGSLGFALTELTGDTVFSEGDGTNNADGTPTGATPFLNKHLGTGNTPDLAYPPTNSLQEGSFIGAYGRGVPFIKQASAGGKLSDRDQWWDFGHDPLIEKVNDSTYQVRPTTSSYYDGKLDTAFAHYRGRELLAGVQRASWFDYTIGTNPNTFYNLENSQKDNLSQQKFGEATVNYWNYINEKLWDNTTGQAGWLEAVGQGYKPCFSGGNDVPIGDWLAPKIGDKVHTLNKDNSALVTVSGVIDEDTPYLSWSWAGSGVNKVEIEYTIDKGNTWKLLPTTQGSDGNYTASIPTQTAGTTVYYYAKAMDNFNNWTAFPQGAETWSNSGDSLGKSIANSQTYTVPVTSFGGAGELPDPSTTPGIPVQQPPVSYGGAEPDPGTNVGGTQDVPSTMLIRTGGKD